MICCPFMPLTETEIARYARQLLLPGLGELAQERLKASRVRVVGAGAVGGPALLYLAEAGVGVLMVDDPEEVGPTDVWLQGPEDAGRRRMDVVPKTLRRANGFVDARAFAPDDRPTCVMVCAESQQLRSSAAEDARRAGLPCVVVEANGGQGAVVRIPPEGPCYACAQESASGSCASPADAAALGALAALEVVLLVTGTGQGRDARRIDLVSGVPAAAPTRRRPGCVCGTDRP